MWVRTEYGLDRYFFLKIFPPVIRTIGRIAGLDSGTLVILVLDSRANAHARYCHVNVNGQDSQTVFNAPFGAARYLDYDAIAVSVVGGIAAQMKALRMGIGGLLSDLGLSRDDFQTCYMPTHMKIFIILADKYNSMRYTNCVRREHMKSHSSRKAIRLLMEARWHKVNVVSAAITNTSTGKARAGNGEASRQRHSPQDHEFYWVAIGAPAWISLGIHPDIPAICTLLFSPMNSVKKVPLASLIWV